MTEKQIALLLALAHGLARAQHNDAELLKKMATDVEVEAGLPVTWAAKQ